MEYFFQTENFQLTDQIFDFCRISTIFVLQKSRIFNSAENYRFSAICTARAVGCGKQPPRRLKNSRNKEENAQLTFGRYATILTAAGAVWASILQNSAEFCRICRNLQDSAEFCRMPKPPKIVVSARIEVVVPLMALLIYFAGIFFKIGISSCLASYRSSAEF